MVLSVDGSVNNVVISVVVLIDMVVVSIVTVVGDALEVS